MKPLGLIRPNRTFVLYHDRCPDGFGAAYAAWTVLGSSARYLPVRHGDPMPPIPDGSSVTILDFSYPRDDLVELAARCARDPISGRNHLVVLDHHGTAKEILDGLDFASFDTSRGGAIMAWEFFRPGEPVPLLLQYVQDCNLGSCNLDQVREFLAALSIRKRSFEAWDSLSRSIEDGGLQGFLEEGSIILAHTAHVVARLCDSAVFSEVGGHVVPVVNTPVFRSEVGEELCRRHSGALFAATFFVRPDGERIYSLRSRTGFDVSAVARENGGSGHPALAEFVVPPDPQQLLFGD